LDCVVRNARSIERQEPLPEYQSEYSGRLGLTFGNNLVPPSFG
jgi:hypothetical protein